MWAAVGLPSILVMVNFQQTFPLAGFSVTSTRPRLDAGAAGTSLVPTKLAWRNLLPVVVAVAIAVSTSAAASAAIVSNLLRIEPPVACCRRLVRAGTAFGF